VWQAAARMRTLAPDLVHFEDIAPRTAPLLFLTPALPKLVSIHDARTHTGDPVTRAEFILRLALHSASRVIFYSRFTHDQFFSTGYVKTASILLLPAYEVYREWAGEQDAVESELNVLFFGRVSAYKGLDVLYRALPLVARRVPRFRVVVAGEPGEQYQLPTPPDLPPGAQLETRFERQEVRELRQLFQAASVVVLPYHEASQSGVVPVAYAFEKPVVATAVGGLPEFVQEAVTGRLVPPGDAQALADALADLLLSPDTRARMAAAIARLVNDELGWSAVAPRLMHVYNETLAGRRACAPS